MERDAWWVRALPASAFVFVCAVLVLLPALWNGFVWDDLNVLVISERLRDPSALVEVFRHPSVWSTGQPMTMIGTYRPMALSTFVVDYQLWGLSPAGYHATSLALHGLACVVVYGFARRFTGSPLTALVVALLCAIHPSAVESAGWINGRSELLALAFGAAALAVACRPQKWTGAVLLGLLLLGAVMSKETGAVFFPLAAALVCSNGVGPARRWCRPRIPPLLAIFAATLAYLAIRSAVLGSHAKPTSFQPLETLAAVPPLWCRALQAVVLPVEPVPITLRLWLANISSIELTIYAVFALAILVGFALAWKKRRIDIMVPGALWLGALLPSALVLSFNWPGLYRWLTIPLPGLFLAVAALIPRTWPRRAVATGLVLYAAFCIALTQRALPLWRNSTSFNQAVIDQDPSDYFGYQNLGTVKMNAGKWDEAAFLFQAAIKLGSDHPLAAEQLAVAWSKLGRCREAIPLFLRYAGEYVPRKEWQEAQRTCGLLEQPRER